MSEWTIMDMERKIRELEQKIAERDDLLKKHNIDTPEVAREKEKKKEEKRRRIEEENRKRDFARSVLIRREELRRQAYEVRKNCDKEQDKLTDPKQKQNNFKCFIYKHKNCPYFYFLFTPEEIEKKTIPKEILREATEEQFMYLPPEVIPCFGVGISYFSFSALQSMTIEQFRYITDKQFSLIGIRVNNEVHDSPEWKYCFDNWFGTGKVLGNFIREALY